MTHKYKAKKFQKPWKGQAWTSKSIPVMESFHHPAVGLPMKPLSLLYLDPSCCDTDAQRHHAGLIAQQGQGCQKRMVPGSAFNMTGGWMRMVISTQFVVRRPAAQKHSISSSLLAIPKFWPGKSQQHNPHTRTMASPTHRLSGRRSSCCCTGPHQSANQWMQNPIVEQPGTTGWISHMRW